MTTETLETPPLSGDMKEKLSHGVSHLEMWRAIKTRNYRYDGIFVFGVSSTGIYCRPSCPARHPRRTRVAYFANLDQDVALPAGFQPQKVAIEVRSNKKDVAPASQSFPWSVDAS